MSTISIKIKGIDKLAKGFATASKETKTELAGAIKRSALIIQRRAKELVPVKTSNLQKSIKVLATPLKGFVQARANYAGYVEYGTRPHVIKAKNKGVLANKKTGQVFGKRVNHPGTKAKPFMGPAADQSQQAIQHEFDRAVKNIINKI